MLEEDGISRASKELAIEPKDTGDQEKLSLALSRLGAEDPLYVFQVPGDGSNCNKGYGGTSFGDYC